MGGTFDPIHIGHLRIAIELCQDLDLQQVKMVPCKNPSHRDGVVAHPEHRLAMLELAVHGQSALSVEMYEYQQSGPSYTINTLRYLYRQVASTPLCLIVGSDAFDGLAQWHEWEHILDFAHIVIAQRPSLTHQAKSSVWTSLAAHFITNPVDLARKRSGCILPWQVTQLAISATKIRRLLLTGKRVKYLLPDVVIDYIRTENIYLK